MTCTSLRFVMTGKPMARRPGFGPWSLMVDSMFVLITENNLAGITQPYVSRRAVFAAAGMTREVDFETAGPKVNDSMTGYTGKNIREVPIWLQ